MRRHICRAFRLALVGLSACAIAPPLTAQQPQLPAIEVGQIVDEVIAARLQPERVLSRVPVAQRRIFLDHQRTMTAFGHSSAPDSLATLQLRSGVLEGSMSLLEDCDVFGRGPCNRLGWGVYVFIEPVALTNSEALVRARVVWPGRPSDSFEEGLAPTGRAFLVGFAVEVHLTRSQDGSWKFARFGDTIVME